jgi:hypothetical protein
LSHLIFTHIKGLADIDSVDRTLPIIIVRPHHKLTGGNQKKFHTDTIEEDSQRQGSFSGCGCKGGGFDNTNPISQREKPTKTVLQMAEWFCEDWTAQVKSSFTDITKGKNSSQAKEY